MPATHVPAEEEQEGDCSAPAERFKWMVVARAIWPRTSSMPQHAPKCPTFCPGANGALGTHVYSICPCGQGTCAAMPQCPTRCPTPDVGHRPRPFHCCAPAPFWLQFLVLAIPYSLAHVLMGEGGGEGL